MDTLSAIAETRMASRSRAAAMRAIVAARAEAAALTALLAAPMQRRLAQPSRTRRDRRGCSARITRLKALLRALDGRFIAPVAGGDLMRTPAILPTGRNLHGFDPYRIPSAFAIAEGAAQAERVLARYRRGRPSRLPEIRRDRALGHRQSQERRAARSPRRSP